MATVLVNWGAQFLGNVDEVAVEHVWAVDADAGADRPGEKHVRGVLLPARPRLHQSGALGVLQAVSELAQVSPAALSERVALPKEDGTRAKPAALTA